MEGGGRGRAGLTPHVDLGVPGLSLRRGSYAVSLPIVVARVSFPTPGNWDQMGDLHGRQRQAGEVRRVLLAEDQAKTARDHHRCGQTPGVRNSATPPTLVEVSFSEHLYLILWMVILCEGVFEWGILSCC